MNDRIYFTISGVCHRYGTGFFEPGQRVTLVKDPDNEYDTEAIKVEMPGLGQVGWVANSVNTRIGESWSAGRLYDKFGSTAYGKVLYVLSSGVLCELEDYSEWMK